MREKRRGREGTRVSIQHCTALHKQHTESMCVCGIRLTHVSSLVAAPYTRHSRSTLAPHSVHRRRSGGRGVEVEQKDGIVPKRKGVCKFSFFLSFLLSLLCSFVTQQTKTIKTTHFPLLLCSFLFFFLPSFSSSSLPLLLPLPFSLPLLLPLLFLFLFSSFSLCLAGLKQGKGTLGGSAGWLVVETGGRWIARK